MNKKNTIFDFLIHVMVVWGISIMSICVFAVLFGESAKGESSIFELGSAGIAIDTILQFLLLSFVITALRWIFFSDIIIKELSIMLRSICMFGSIFLAVAVMAVLFKWFPAGSVKPWIMFLVSFIICGAVSIGISALKEKTENRKMQEALDRLKEEDI